MGKPDTDTRAFLRDAALRPGGALGNWGLLRTFFFIAEAGSITGAARMLSISQPSVSASLQRLEELLGQRLIDRSGRRFVLTAPGQVLYAETERMFRAAERAEERLSQQSSGLTGLIRIQTVTGGRSPAFDEALRLMHTRHPAASFRVDIASSQVVIRNVAERIVPFGICLMLRPFSGLDCRLILRAEYGIYCGREHPMFGRSDIRIEDLRHEGFIGFACTEEGSAPEPHQVLRVATGLGDRMVGSSTDITEVMRMTAAGLGITILPLPVGEPEARAGRLWRVDVDMEPLWADLFLISNPAARLTETERAFAAIADEVLHNAPRDSVILPGTPAAG